MCVATVGIASRRRGEQESVEVQIASSSCMRAREVDRSPAESRSWRSAWEEQMAMSVTTVGSSWKSG